MAPDFLSVADVCAIHSDQISRYGGTNGLRSVELLEGAVAAPQATLGGAFLHDGPAEMAAAYLWHLVQDHPFVDGNNRTGLAVALVFQVLNGVDVVAPEEALEGVVWAVARGEADREQVAQFLRQHARSPDP